MARIVIELTRPWPFGGRVHPAGTVILDGVLAEGMEGEKLVSALRLNAARVRISPPPSPGPDGSAPRPSGPPPAATEVSDDIEKPNRRRRKGRISEHQ